MKIGILSDTHDLLRPEVLEQLVGCDRILHGGDISSQKILWPNSSRTGMGPASPATG